MKIAYVTVRFPCGPPEMYFASEVRELADCAHQVVVIPTRPLTSTVVYRGLSADVLRLPLFGLRTFYRALIMFARRPLAVVRVFARLALARDGVRAKAKDLAVLPKALAVSWEVRRRAIDHIHALWLSTPSTVAYVVSELTGIPWSCSAHRFDATTGNLLRPKFASAKFVRTISESTRRLLIERGGDVVGTRCYVVHLGVSVPRDAHEPRHNRPLRLLCPGRLVPKRGHQYLFEALVELRRRGIAFDCDVAGDGPLDAELRQTVANLGLSSSVAMCGTIPHDIFLSRLQNSFYDAVVLAGTEIEGQLDEGISVALMEAMAVGVPCVATRTGSITELIEDRRSSLVVPQRDAMALADAIAELALHPERRVDVGLSARRRICDAFDVRLTTRRLCELMEAS